MFSHEPRRTAVPAALSARAAASALLPNAGLSAEEDEPVGAGKRLAGSNPFQRGQEPSALD